MGGFYQDPPRLGNQFRDDRMLRSLLARLVPADVLHEIEPDLDRFGERVVGDIAAMGADAEANPPRFIPFDPWGRRIDRIDVARGWQQLAQVSAEEGLVAIGYERRQGPASRLYQFAKLYLFNPSSSVYTCPLAMADGAARLIETHGDAQLKSHAFRRLISRDPARAWTSGQWMTERTGGSDVGRSETIARADGDHFLLYGTKWFTSATTSEMTMTLARMESDGASKPGSRGLSVFYLETRDAAGALNNITIHRLKDKLGTKALPTAELTMDGTRARLIGEAGRGVPTIATLVNVTRLYNSICAVSGARRALALARDYARRREAFGRPLIEHPAHQATLAGLEVELAGGVALTLSAVDLMGREECGAGTADDAAILRLLTPLCKLWTAKLAVSTASEALECFGGAGYVEDTGLPKLLRDAQVLPIWEGTTNVLSLDALRAIEKEQALVPLLGSIKRRLAQINHPGLVESVERVRRSVGEIEAFVVAAVGDGRAALEAAARPFAIALARTAACAVLLEQAQWSADVERDGRWALIAERFCRGPQTALRVSDEHERRVVAALAGNDTWPLPAATLLAAQGEPVG